MKIIHLKSDQPIPVANLALCIGFFDGMHIAHQKLLQATVKEQFKTGIMTFSTHIPTFMQNRQYYALTVTSDKIAIANSYDFDYFFILDVSADLVMMEPDRVIGQYLASCAKVIVGFDFRFGHNGSGDAWYLQSRLPEQTIIIPELDYYNKKVGSTRIRKQLAQGNISVANKLLGRKYQINGKVIEGHKRGKTLGYPTANVDYDGYYLPKPGVYYTTVCIQEKEYDAMTYIGFNPTFQDRNISLETHIFGLNREIYDEGITIFFDTYVRKEMTFARKEDLIAQINKDKKDIHNLISSRRVL